MSNSTLKEDSKLRPDLFRWSGPISGVVLAEWLGRYFPARRVPGDLVEFWAETGGGDLFETECMLGPLGSTSLGEDLLSVNRDLRSRGLSSRYLVFHLGLCLSAVDTDLGDYVVLDEDTYDVRRRFTSIDEWYTEVLRREYGARYGLVSWE